MAAHKDGFFDAIFDAESCINEYREVKAIVLNHL